MSEESTKWIPSLFLHTTRTIRPIWKYWYGENQMEWLRYCARKWVEKQKVPLRQWFLTHCKEWTDILKRQNREGCSKRGEACTKPPRLTKKDFRTFYLNELEYVGCGKETENTSWCQILKTLWNLFRSVDFVVKAMENHRNLFCTKKKLWWNMENALDLWRINKILINLIN